MLLFENKVLMGRVAVVIMFVAYAWQLLKTWKGESKPHPVAWIGFGFLTGIGYLVQRQEGAGAGSWVMGLTAIFCFIIAGTSQYRVRWQKRDFDNWDWAALIGGLGLCGLYLISKNRSWGPTLSATLATLADLLLYIPIFRRAWMFPYDEFVPAYALNSLKFAPSIFAMSAYSMATCLYPSAMIIANAAVVFYLLWRRRDRNKKFRATTKALAKTALIIALIICVIAFFRKPLKSWLEDTDNHALFDIISLFSAFFLAAIGLVFSYRADKQGELQELEIQSQNENLKTASTQLNNILESITGTTRDLSNISLSIERTKTELERISQSMSTRYIDSFPNHLKDIVALIKDAQECIYIASDCVDSGSFSNPEDHAKVIEAIKAVKDRNADRQKKVEIRIRICGEAQAISRSSEFWNVWQATKGNEDKWVRLRDEEGKFRTQLLFYCEFNKEHLSGFDPEKCSRRQFQQMMLTRHEEIKLHLRDELDVKIEDCKHLDHMPGIFFWMKDRKEAVFLLSHTGVGTQEIIFFTRDGNIIKILDGAWNNIKALEEQGQTRIACFRQYQNLQGLLALIPEEKHEHVKLYSHALGKELNPQWHLYKILFEYGLIKKPDNKNRQA